MIINTGMRTDIPAFYSQWLCNRLRAGFVMVRNPYDASQVTRYRLDPEVVDLIGFCTKDPGPMLPRMEALRDYGQYWFVTITPYGREIEPRVPAVEQVIGDFQTLSEIVGPDCIGWRYDPVFVNEKYTTKRHRQAFEYIASRLAGYTRTCVISFIDLYEKTKRNFPEVRAVPAAARLELGAAFVEIGRQYGMTIRPCAEGDELAAYGADCSGCMTMQTYEIALGCRLRAPKAAATRRARPACACYLSCDIGAYNTCGHLCRYCYANYNAAAVRRNMAAHDPESPFLIGGPLPGDRIHEAEQASWKDQQISLFDAAFV